MSKDRLPGVFTLTARASNSGSYTSAEGLGNMSIGIDFTSPRPYLDLMSIDFRDVSIERYKEIELDALTDPNVCSKIKELKCNIDRRLSRKQAQWLTDKVSAFIQSLGYIPADDDI